MKWLWVKATGKFGIGSQCGKCGCGCQLAPSGPNEPQPSGRTPKLCFPAADGLHAKDKSRARTSQAGIRRWHGSVDKRMSAWPTCWMARLVSWEIHDYHMFKKAGARIRNRAANANLPRCRRFTARCIFRSSGSLDREAAGLVDTWYQHHWSFRDSIQEGS